MVGLAKRLEGKPFHLVASHCQNNQTREEVIAYVKKNGLAANTPNVTVCKQGRHRKVKGNGFVPYYIVFNHHGEMAHHHMCGAYHGGDGLKMIEWVDKLLKDTPVIYLGKQPFKTHEKLAKQIESGKNLTALDTAMATARDDSELKRMHDAVRAYHARRLAEAERMLATDPTAVVPALKDLSKQFKGTELGKGVDEKLAAMQKSPELKDSIALWKKFAKVVKRVDKLKEPSKTALEKQAARLEKMIEGRDKLPVTATIRAYIEELRK